MRIIRPRGILVAIAALVLVGAADDCPAATIQLLSSQTSIVGNATASVSPTGFVSIDLLGDDLFSSATVTADFLISEPGGFWVGMSGVVDSPCYDLLTNCPTFSGATLALIRLDPSPALVLDVTPHRSGTTGDTFNNAEQPFDVGTYRVVAQLSQLGGGTPFRISGGISTSPIPEVSSAVLFPLGIAISFVAWASSRPRSHRIRSRG